MATKSELLKKADEIQVLAGGMSGDQDEVLALGAALADLKRMLNDTRIA